MEQCKRPVVHMPEDAVQGRCEGSLYGYHHPSTQHYNICAVGQPPNTLMQCLGVLVKDRDITDVGDDQLLACWYAGRLSVLLNGVECEVRPYSRIKDVFSRNSGILETSLMLSRRVLVIGAGSVGSLAALELARAGVGHFLLVDHDILEYHNLARHQCGVSDVGRYKVDALSQRILDINPDANIESHRTILESLPRSVFDKWCNRESLLLACADSRAGDIYAAKICSMFEMPFLSIGLWERAFAGELFYSIPERNQPCYVCQFGSAAAELSSRTEANRRIYTNEESLEGIRFEPGISVDIGYVTNIGIKLAIDILNRDSKDYIPKLLPYLSQFTLVCNSTDTRIGGPMAEIFSYPLQVTTNITSEFGSNCPPCRYPAVGTSEQGT